MVICSSCSPGGKTQSKLGAFSEKTQERQMSRVHLDLVRWHAWFVQSSAAVLSDLQLQSIASPATDLLVIGDTRKPMPYSIRVYITGPLFVQFVI